MKIKTLAVACAVAMGGAVHAEDAYVTARVRDLVDRSSFPSSVDEPWWGWESVIDAVQHPYAALDVPGEVYVVPDTEREGWTSILDATVAVRTSAPGDATGTLFVPNVDLDGFTATAFELTTGDDADERTAFMEARHRHYRRLAEANLPGGAWFRHQARRTAAALGRAPEAPPREPAAPWGEPGEMEQTFGLISGGLALSENLQLDRMIGPADRGAMTVEVDTIEGITVHEFDWARLVEGLDPARDRLAAMVPADQHVVLFPSFEAMLAMVDRADEIAAPIMPAVEPRAEHAGVRDRYERQLCLPLTRAARELGPRLIDDVALTGSDPYFRTGTDVAVLFTGPDPPALRRSLAAYMALTSEAEPDAETLRGEVGGTPYVGLHTDDRRICTHLALIGDVVVVTNSLAQLERLTRTAAGATPALVTLPEYVFFRDRYRRDDPSETALIILSDATIRRLCGPRWRIGTSRRTRAAAVLADIQASHLDRLVAGEIEWGPVHPAHPVEEDEQLTLDAHGIASSVYGTLAFQTPIAELDLDRVTPEEAHLYTVWRDRYQRRWRDAFDPIAVRFGIDGDRTSMDLTVMPLIEGTEYATLLSISRGASLAPGAGDPHDGTVAHAVLAINHDAPLVQMYAGMLSGMTRRMVDPLGWLGSAVALYVEDDPVLAELEEGGWAEGFEEELFELPIALYVEARDGMKLTLFLTGLRAFIDQTAPGMTVWENLEHDGVPFVKVGPSPQAQVEGAEEEMSIYYAASGKALVVATREDVLRRAIDRQRQAAAEGTPPWLGRNLNVRLDRRCVPVVEAMFAQDLQRRMQLRAWRNIPILNEWRQRYGDEDGAELHARFWHRRPICPGGGTYRWNERWRTIESTVFGHPGAPRTAGRLDVLAGVRGLDAGLTFEPDGLRARIALDRGTD
ncbi:MAG: hypothetical protein ACYTGP_04140 [Planctomycetota bacterium]|jgi:hypothetical protein